jgi:hypothetical protein
MTDEQKNQILKAVENYVQYEAWVPLAKLLAEAKDRGDDLSFAGLKNNANRLISAYRFLEVRRPDILETPEEILGQFRAIACLPTLWKRLSPGEEREKRIQAILENIINNRIPTYVVERYATTLTDESKKLIDSYVIPTHLQKFEEKLLPPSENVKTAIKAYKDGGHWLHLVKFLMESKDNHEDLSDVGLSSSQINRMITAYRFLEVKRPELLREPEKLTASIGALSILPTMSGKLPAETIDDYFEKIITGEISEKKLLKISTSLSDTSQPLTPLEEGEDQKVAEILQETLKTLNMLITKYGHEALRNHHAQICDDLATQFRCVADPGYKKQWDSRKEGKL